MQIRGTTSCSFFISRGVRQGSVLLFLLVMLLELKSCKVVKSVVSMSISAHADDISNNVAICKSQISVLKNFAESGS